MNVFEEMSVPAPYGSRWTLWRFDPNETALIAVYLFCFLFPLLFAAWELHGRSFRRLVWQAASALGCIVAAFGLAQTGSRGGAIAFAAVLAVAYLSAKYTTGRSVSEPGVVRVCLGVVIAVTLGILVLANPRNRVTVANVMADRSVTNRLAIWKACPQMVYDSSFLGWDIPAGELYSNWYSTLPDEIRYKNLVSGYLDIAVTYGLPGLFAAFFLLFLIVSLFLQGLRTTRSTRDRRSVRIWATIGLTAATAFAASNLFSSHLKFVFASPILLALGVTIALLRFRVFSRAVFLTSLSVSFIATAMIGAGIIGYCHFQKVESLERCVIASDRRGWITVAKHLDSESSDKPSTCHTILYDGHVLGSIPGVYIRRLAETMPSGDILRTHIDMIAPKAPPTAPSGYSSRLFLMGAACQLLGMSPISDPVFIVLPSFPPPSKTIEGKAILVLGRGQPLQLRLLWLDWAKKNGITVCYIDGVADELSKSANPFFNR